MSFRGYVFAVSCLALTSCSAPADVASPTSLAKTAADVDGPVNMMPRRGMTSTIFAPGGGCDDATFDVGVERLQVDAWCAAGVMTIENVGLVDATVRNRNTGAQALVPAGQLVQLDPAPTSLDLWTAAGVTRVVVKDTGSSGSM